MRHTRSAPTEQADLFPPLIGPAAKLVDLGGEVEIGLGYPAGGVRGEPERDRGPTNIDIGMVVGLLGQLAHGVDIRQGCAEVRS